MSSPHLFVARYDLSAGHKQVLLFKEGDCFIPLPNWSTNPNWALCVDRKGKIGYVPYTYVIKKQVTSDEFLWLLDASLEKLHADSPSGISKLTRDVIKDLTSRRTKLLKSIQSSSTNDVDKEDAAEEEPMPNGSVVPPPQQFGGHDDTIPSKNCDEQGATCPKTAECGTQMDSVSSVPTWLVPSLIEGIRRKTQLSHENSKAAISVILDLFLDGLPQLSTIWCQLKHDLEEAEVIQEDSGSIFYSEDKRKLFDIFKQLWYCKNDEQQRSWPVHEDEAHISSLLIDLNEILLDANPLVTTEVVQCDDYEMVNLLATYYQMEPRRALRVKMLHVFLTLCELDSVIVTQLLNSVLPMELARDIQDNFEDEEKVRYSAILLTVIFSTGEQPPTGTYDFINKKFLHFLFEKLEDVFKKGEEDLGENLLSIILAFNLHLQNGQENFILGTLKERQYAQFLTEKLVFLLNREKDPTKILSSEVESRNSVLKFMVDLFSIPELIDLFYLNDIKVLLDIIVRQLSDLLPGEKKRLDYLHLVRNLLRNSNYDEHLHQVEGLQKCFHFVLVQEVPEEEEATIIRDILDQFPSWFQEK